MSNKFKNIIVSVLFLTILLLVFVLNILKPIIKKIVIIPLEDKRIVDKNNLLNIIKQLNIENEETLKIEEDEEYLVFGSFLVIEKFLTLIGFNDKS